MSSNADPAPVQFEPLRPVSRKRLIAALVFGPLLWLILLVCAAWVFRVSYAIEIGIAVTAASFFTAALVLSLLHRGRVRQERPDSSRG